MSRLVRVFILVAFTTFVVMAAQAQTTSVLVSPTPGSTLSGTSATFTWSAGNQVIQYDLMLGTTLNGHDILDTGHTTATSATVTNLPVAGQVIYARLYSLIGSTWSATNYTYTAAAFTAVLNSPAPGSYLAGTTVTFGWTAGTGATQYQLSLGTTAGASDLYNSGSIAATLATVTGLPSTGQTIYARLSSLINGTWWAMNYTYTAWQPTSPAVLTSPVPGSTLLGSTATFVWSGLGVSQYELLVGTTYHGSDILNTGHTTATSATVTNLPVTGQVIYARLYSLIQNTWSAIDYTYTAATPPSITSISPTSGLVGTGVTITGTNFGATQGTSAVSFNGSAAMPTSWSNTQIVVPVPAGATTGNVVVTVNGLANSGVSFTVLVPPSVSALSPTTGPVGTSVTITGTNFGATQGASTVSFNGTAAIPTSWSNAQIVVPVPLGATTGNVVVTVNSLPSSGVSFTVLLQLSPVLMLRVDDTPATVNLSDPVNLDWVVWGADGSTPAATRSAAGLISDYTVLGSSNVSVYDTGTTKYTWSGGTPIASSSGSTPFISVYGLNAGFQLTVPADTTVKTLKLYATAYSNVQMNVSISDSSSPAVSSTSITASFNEMYSIDFRAGTAGQTLTVQLFSTDPGSGVSLEAAVLQPHLPSVTLVSPQDRQSFAFGSAIPVALDVEQYDYAIASAQISSNGTQLFAAQGSPFSATWTGAPQGHYQLQASATDANGLSGNSKLVAIDVIGSGGNLTDSFGSISSVVDLTAEGTADWITFAQGNWNYTTGSHKAGVYRLIADPTIVGTEWGSASWYSSNGYFSFEDGTPDAQEYNVTPTSFISSPPGTGFELSIKADTAPRTLRLYCNAGGPAELRAYLSDGSAPVVIDTSLQDSNAQYVFTINFNAASAGQTLVIDLTSVSGGAISLNAATLSGTSSPLPPQVTAIQSNYGVPGDLVTISGNSFGSQQGVVSFNGIPGVVSSWSASTINAFVPVGVASGPVTVTTAGGTSNADVIFTLRPSILAITPSSGSIGTVVTLNGSGFGSSQLAGTVNFTGAVANPTSWSDSQIVVMVPSGVVSGPVTAVQGTAISNPVWFTFLGGAPVSPLLKVRVDDTPSTVNLSDPVNLDWIVWGADGKTTAVTRSSAANLVGDPMNGATASSYEGCRTAFNWSGGAPIAGGTRVVGGVSVTDFNGGIVLTAPAGTTVQTLKVYVQDWQNPQFVASLSDGSSPNIVDTSVSGPNYVGEEKTYSFDYRAASNGQQLTVTITGSVSLEAAVLQPHLPEVSLLSPSTGQSFTATSDIPLGLNSLQFDNGIAATTIKANQNQIFSSNTAPYSGIWQPSAGHYHVRATATDSAGLSSSSAPVGVDIIGSGGTLSGQVTTLSQSSTISTDLTAEGTADWIVFAPSYSWSGNNGTQSYMGVIRKSGVTPLISTVKESGQGNFGNSQGSTGESFQFEDGSPDSIDSGINFYAYAGGAASGYEITVAADTTPRTLRVHAAVAGGTAQLKAFLSDGSAPVLVDRSLIPSSGMWSVGGVYSITYQAASAGQTLTVRLTVDGTPLASDNWRAVQIYAATLDGSAIIAAPQITSVTPTSGTSGTIVSIRGSGFGETQGTGSYVSVGGLPASIIGWSVSEVDVEVPAGACGGPLVVTANGLVSNAVDFTIPAQIAITPTSAGLLVGQNLQLNAINASCGTPLSGATWSLTPSTGVASLSSDAQPVLTGIGTGNVTVTAALNGFTSSATFQVAAAGTAAPPVPTPTPNPNPNPSAYASSITLTNSLGATTTYDSTYVGGQRLIIDSNGPGCSTCDIRGVNYYSYDSQGNVTSLVDALGNTVNYSYDSLANILAQSKMLNASTAATTGYTYNSFNEVLTVTDALGNITSNSYDTSGNLTSVTAPSPGGGAPSSVTQFGYDSKGELIQITDSLGHVSKLTYTSAGLIQSITDAQQNVTSYEYDSRGNRTAVIDAKQQRTTFAYDLGNRLTGITYPDSTTASFGYDYRGRKTSATDQNGKTTTYTYDDADRLIAITDASGNVTQYAFDTESNLLSITDANGHSTSFSYDPYGRVTQTTFPSTLYEVYSYDAVGNLLSKTDRGGNSISYVYDALNRLTHKGYSDSTGVDYVYDLVGKIQHVNDPTGNYGFAYDNVGRLIGTTTSYSFLPGQTFNNTYGYDAASNRTSFTAPDSSTVQYTYDTLNRLTNLSNSWAGSFGFSYDPLSRRTQLTRPNGINTGYQYDSLSRLLSVLHNGSNDGANYSYDAAGNRSSKQNLLTGVTENYSYDPIYQLTQVMKAAKTTESYSYDAVGNRLSSIGYSPLSYNSSNELLSSPSSSFTYDNSGNMLSKTTSSGSTTYAWDFENRLSSVTLPNNGGTVNFRYDPLGRRIQKTSPSGATIYLYDGANIVAELSASGAVTASYTQGVGVDEPLAMQRGVYVNYFNADGLGSVTSLTNNAGHTVSSYVYHAFGSTTATEGIFNPFRYTGREQDPETGLYFYRARYYDPSIGRFISEDPIGFGGGINFYRYVLNSPLTLIDPDGRDITVVRYKATNPWGHVGLGVNSDTTEGFYPDKDNQAVTGGPGHVQVDTHQVIDYVTIPATPDQDAAVQRYINAHRKGHYSFTNSNCTRFVEHALGNAGISSSDTINPETLMQDLHKAYDPPAPVPPPTIQYQLDNPGLL